MCFLCLTCSNDTSLLLIICSAVILNAFHCSLFPSLSDYSPQPGQELPLPSPGLLRCLSGTDLTTVHLGSVCMLLSDLLLLRLQRARGPLGAVSCHRLFCVLSLFLKVMVEDGIGNRFWFFRLLFRQEKTSSGLWHRHTRLEGHLTPFTSGNLDLFPNPAGVLLPLLLPVEFHIGSHQECKSPKAASYCSSLLIFCPSDALSRG